MYPKINVNTNQINKVLKEVGKRVDRIAFERLQAAAEVGAAVAREGFANAIYDGVNDVTVFTDSSTYARTVEIIAVGDAAKYIEYGTGLQGGKKSSYINPVTGRNYWYFSDKGGDVQLTAGGTNAENSWYRTTTDSVEYIGKVDGQEVSYPEEDVGDDPELGYSAWDDELEDFVKVERRATREPAKNRYKVYGDPKYKEHSFITHGNPPNHIMRHVLHEVVREFHESYKSPYSKSK
jgi:hypothetical protein